MGGYLPERAFVERGNSPRVIAIGQNRERCIGEPEPQTAR
jgi:hypothetical protein